MHFVESLDVLQVRSILGENFSELLPQNGNIDIYECAASELLTASRIDLAVKYLYVKYRIEKIDSPFAHDAYLDHIKAFNGFVEADGSGKVGAEKFTETYDSLIDQIHTEGFSNDSLVPISEDGVLLDGAHRVAICLYLKKNVRVVRVSVRVGPCFDMAFFQSRGMKELYADVAVRAYIDLKPTTRTMIVWPTAQGKDAELLSIVSDHARIVCRKSLFLSNEGAVHLTMAAYKQESWLGSSNDDFVGARNKARWCFEGKGPVRIFLVETDVNLLPCKEQIRALYEKEKHSIHINDEHYETVELAKLIFNENSVHFMNHAPVTGFPWFMRLFRHYDQWLKSISADDENYCVDGSAVLAIYGVREARDLDYFYVGEDPVESGFKEISPHNDAVKYYPCRLDDIVFNPAHHFFFQNRKVVAITMLRKMKQTRNEKKDIDDVVMLDSMLENGRMLLPISFIIKRALTPAFIKGRIKLLALKVRYFLYLFLNKAK